jgi:hypothetical protein
MSIDIAEIWKTKIIIKIIKTIIIIILPLLLFSYNRPDIIQQFYYKTRILQNREIPHKT